MVNMQSIVKAIHARVNKSKTLNYSTWRIGLSHDPDARKDQHNNNGEDTQYWLQWEADSLSDAENIESYFKNEKNMKGGTGGNLSHHKTIYVYIF